MRFKQKILIILIPPNNVNLHMGVVEAPLCNQAVVFTNLLSYNQPMDEKWKVVLYRSPSGDYPVQQFIDSLEIKAQAKVRNTVKLVQDFGIRLGLPHLKKLTGTDLWELRILGSDSLRLVYVAVTGRTFVLLHGFKKKKDKTPQKEIRIAEERLAEYRSRTTK